MDTVLFKYFVIKSGQSHHMWTFQREFYLCFSCLLQNMCQVFLKDIHLLQCKFLWACGLHLSCFFIHLPTGMDTFYWAFPEFTLEKYYYLETLTPKRQEKGLRFPQQMNFCFRKEHRISVSTYENRNWNCAFLCVCFHLPTL